MKPPRYLLRERVVLEALHSFPVGSFLEIGFGSGTLLVALEARGFHGTGVDFSDQALKHAKDLIRRGSLKAFEVASEIPAGRSYDWIGFFEVMGYWSDPVRELCRLRLHLNEGGRLIFSFMNRSGKGAAEALSGNYRCFDRSEITELFAEAGYDIKLMWNYGFPLINLLRPILHIYYRYQYRLATTNTTERIKESGFGHRLPLVRLASILLNRVTIMPFAVVQTWFRRSDLGSGYVAIASPKPSNYALPLSGNPTAR